LTTYLQRGGGAPALTLSWVLVDIYPRGKGRSGMAVYSISWKKRN